MVDAFVRDYLIERVEMALDHRVLTGYYPRLSLAPGHRFASKGGYIGRFTDPQGSRVTPLGEGITPWAPGESQLRGGGGGSRSGAAGAPAPIRGTPPRRAA